MHTVLTLEKEAATIRSESYSDSVVGAWAQQHVRVVLYGSNLKHAWLGPFLHELASDSLAGLKPSNTSRTSTSREGNRQHSQ